MTIRLEICLTALLIYLHLQQVSATQLTSWNMTITLDNSIITLFFDDDVNVNTCNPAALALQSAASRTSVLILADVPSNLCTASSSSTLQVSLTTSILQQLLCNFDLATNSTNTYLSMGSNFVRTLTNAPVEPILNTEAVRVAMFNLTLPSPSVVQANRLVLNSGYLDFNLNVPVRLARIDATHLTLVSGMSSYTITSADQRFTITNCFQIGLVLSTFDLDRVKITLLPEGSSFMMRTTPGAFVSIDEQQNIAQSNITLLVLNDTIGPGVINTSIDFSTRILMIIFSEPVNIGSFNSSKVSLVNQLQAPTVSYNLSNAIASSEQPQNHTDTLSITLTPEFILMIEIQPFIGDTRANTILSLQVGFIQDFAGNPYNRSNALDNILFDTFVADQIMPELTNAIMDLNTGYLHLTFNEPVKLTTFNTYEICFFNTTCNSTVSNRYALQSGVVHSGGITSIVDVQVSYDLDDIITLVAAPSHTCLYLSQSTAMDYANRPLRPVFFNATLIRDTSNPSASTFYMNSNISLVIVFDETVDVQSFNTLYLFVILNSTSSGNAYNASDSNATVQEQNSNNMEVTFSSEFLTIEVTNGTTLYDVLNSNDTSIQLHVLCSLVTDLSGNQVLDSVIDQCGNCMLMSPMLTGFDMDMNSGMLILSFSQIVTLQWIDGNITVTNNNSSPDSVYALMNLSISTPSPSLVYNISISASDVFSLQSIPRLATMRSNTYLQLQPQVAVSRAGLNLNNTVPIRASEFVPDTTRPIVTALDLDLDAGLFSIEFSEPVSLNTFNITSVGLVNMINGTVLYLANATALSSGIQLLVNYFLDQSNLINIKRQELCYTMTNCYSTISSDAAEDAVGNNVVQIPVNMPLRIRQLTFDVTPPYLIAFSRFDLNAGTFTLLFNEPVNSSSADVTVVQFGNAYLTPTHTISLTDAFTSPDHTEIMFTLSDADLNTIKNNTNICTMAGNCWIRLPRFFISDIHTNPFYIPGSVASFHQPAVFIGDSTPPVLSSFIADADRSNLILLFNEVIVAHSLNPSDITILNSQNGSIRLQLSEESTVTLSNLTTLVIGMTRSDLNILQYTGNIFTGVSNTFLSIASVTQLSDVSGNVVEIIPALVAIQATDFISDQTPPQLLSFVEFNMNNGSLVFSFSEPIDRDRIDLTRLSLQGLQNGGPRFTLNGGTVSNITNYDTVVEIFLLLTDREIIKVTERLAEGANSTFIYFTENAFFDTTGNGAIAKPSRVALHLQDEGYIMDSSRASLLHFELDMNQGTITLTFDDAVNINSVSFANLLIQNQSTSSESSYPLSGGIVRNNSLGGINSYIQLTQRDQNEIKGILSLAVDRSNTYISISSQFVRDYEGRNIIPIPEASALQASFYVVDTTPPELEAFASLDMNLGMLVLIFSETILVGNTVISNVILQHAQNSSMYSYSLQDSVITTTAIASVDITIQLSYNDWNTIKSTPLLAKTSGYSLVRLVNAAVTDTALNSLQLIPVEDALLVTSFITDSTQPRLTAFDLTFPNSTLTLYFSEAVNLTTANTGGLYVINEAALPAAISQSLQSIGMVNVQLENLTSVVISLTSDILNILQNPIIDIGHSASVTYINASSSTIQDFYGNTLFEIPSASALRVRYLRHSCQLDREYDDYAITGECQACQLGCVGGCSGPLNIATADGGCNSCDKIVLYQNNSQMTCLSKSTLCGRSYFNTTSPVGTGYTIPPLLTQGGSLCIPCDDLCSDCYGTGTSQCSGCKYALRAVSNQFQCMQSCAVGDDSCSACHTECDGCNGPTSRDCIRCENANISDVTGLICVPVCTESNMYLGLAPNGNEYICIPCNEACDECTGPGSNSCKACAFFNASIISGNNQCVVTCSGGYYGDINGYCEPCHEECSTCATASSVNCTACLNDEITLSNGSRQCVPKCSFAHKYQTDSGSCELQWSYIATVIIAPVGGFILCVVFTFVILCCVYRCWKRKKNRKYYNFDNKTTELKPWKIKKTDELDL